MFKAYQSRTKTHTQIYRPNAFDITMQAQREKSKNTMPDLIEEPKTNKQKLWNDVIKFLKERNCMWKSGEGSSIGCSFVQALTNTLWTIDGHHEVFRLQGFVVPSIFGSFLGYNFPELSKHRKRTRANLSVSVLNSLGSHLFDCLHGMCWDREHWKELKPDVEALAKCLSHYADYLQKSNKNTLLNQSLTTPV